MSPGPLSESQPAGVGAPWDRLPPWPRGIDGAAAPLKTDELAAEWRRRFDPAPWDRDTLVAIRGFLASWTPILSDIFAATDLHARWLQERLRQYSAETKEYRDQYRSADLKRADQDAQVRLADLAVFRTWYHVASDAERESFSGVLGRVYLLQLENDRKGPPTQAVDRLREGAKLCDDAAARLPQAHNELRRRGYTMRSKAAERLAFGQLGQRRQPARIAPLFEEAAIEAENANRIKPYAGDMHPAYLEFWRASMALRAAQREGAPARARACWTDARSHSAKFSDPAGLFKRAGLWSSTRDFERESMILGAMEAMEAGVSGLHRAAELLQLWTREITADDLVLEPRKRRARIRELIARAFVELAEGRQPHGLVAEAMGLLALEPSMDVSSHALVELTRETISGRSPLSNVVERALCFIAPDYVVDREDVPSPGDVFRYAPSWYRRWHGNLTHGAATSPLLVRWYLRVVADYLYSVYSDHFEELPLPVQIPSRPDLALADLPALYQLFQALHRALGWTGYIANALEELIIFVELALHSPSDEELFGGLLATMAMTQQHLYPTPATVVSHREETDTVRVRIYVGDEGEQLVRPPYGEMPKNGFFYLKPRYKEHKVIERRDGRATHIYSASAFGRPRKVVLVCEGPTDKLALEAILEVLDSTWKLLDVVVDAAGGAEVAAEKAAGLLKLGTAVVLLVDGDRVGAAGNDWDVVWRHCYTTAIDPDIERYSYVALKNALADLCEHEVSVTDLYRLDSEARATGTRYSSLLADYYKINHVKGEQLGAALGRAFVEHGIPEPLRQVAMTTLRVANGLPSPCLNRRSHDHVASSDIVKSGGG